MDEHDADDEKGVIVCWKAVVEAAVVATMIAPRRIMIIIFVR